MFKNKDGSYNKIQLLIISLIAIIGIDVVLSSLFVSEDPLKLLSISLLIVCAMFIPITAMSLFKKPQTTNPVVEKPIIPEIKKPEVVIPNQKEIILTTSPEVNNALEYFREQSEKQIPIEKPTTSQPIIKPYEPSRGSGIDMVSLIMTVVIAAVTMMIGLVVVSNLQAALPEMPSAQFSTQTTALTENLGTAFNFLAIGLFVLAAVFIIGIVAGVLGR